MCRDAYGRSVRSLWGSLGKLGIKKCPHSEGVFVQTL